MLYNYPPLGARQGALNKRPHREDLGLVDPRARRGHFTTSSIAGTVIVLASLHLRGIS